MSSTVTGSNGVQIPLEDTPLAFAYAGGFIDTITVVYRGITYIQTFTNDGTNVTAISAWVAQP